jgi:dihydrofolate reductase
MGKLTVFNQVSLDGYFVDATGDNRWAFKDPSDAEWNAFVSDNASGGGRLLFGRHTYEHMADFWPTPAARQMMPVVAERMNSRPKVVFSRRLEKATWNNTRLVKDNLVEEVRKLKQESREGLTILGSGTIVAQLTEARLIDGYNVVIAPVILGSGRTMFEGVKERVGLKLTQTRAFKNGSVFLCYEAT